MVVLLWSDRHHCGKKISRGLTYKLFRRSLHRFSFLLIAPYEFLVGQSNSIAGMTVATNNHTGGPRIMPISLLIFFKTFLVFKGQLISKGLFGILEFFQKMNEQIRF